MLKRASRETCRDMRVVLWPIGAGDGLEHNNKPDEYAVARQKDLEEGRKHEAALEFISFNSFAKICTGITLAQSIQSYKSSGKKT